MITHELNRTTTNHHDNPDFHYQNADFYTESWFNNYLLLTDRDHSLYVSNTSNSWMTISRDLFSNEISVDLADNHNNVHGESQYPILVYNAENIYDPNHAPQYSSRVYGQSWGFSGWHFTEEYFNNLRWSDEMKIDFGSYITHGGNTYPFEKTTAEIRVNDIDQNTTIVGSHSITFYILEGLRISNSSHSNTNTITYGQTREFHDDVSLAARVEPIYATVEIVPAKLDRNDGDEILAYVYAHGNSLQSHQIIGTEDVYGTMHSTGNKEESERIVFEKRKNTWTYTNPARTSQDANISGVIKVADKHYYDYWRNQTTTDSSRGLEEKSGSLVPYNFSGTYTRDLNFYINEELNDVHLRINYPIASPLIDDDGGTELSVRTSESELPDKEMPKQFFTADDLEVIREENLSLEEILKLLSK